MKTRVVPMLMLVAGCGATTGEPIDGGADASFSPDAAPDATSEDAPSGVTDAGADARPSPGSEFVGPALLSETGLYANLASGELAPGVMPYRVRFELWADDASKERWLYLPEGMLIDTSDPDAWEFPVGTRAWKEFTSGGVRVETRFLVKVEPDRWENVAYVWRLDGSDADARPDGVADALGTTHDVPGIDGCWDCHRGAIDGLNGVGAIQLVTGEAGDLLERLETGGLVTDPITPRPSVPGTLLEQSALGYLHANCAHCHDATHPLARFRTMRMRIPLGLTDPLDAPALRTIVGTMMAHEIDGTTIGIVPGDPLASQLYARMLHRGDEYQMPPRGTEIVDVDGAETIRAFIEGLAPTP